ncbi:MAG: aminoacyl-tRNA hydrolase [Dysgonamonadaceae bacterium]|jgi:PTH1 family peptidyl-tRNA hydrolase|nr:aminoacyl-tRNA hydrolase [Dysgonamonadaceae bacterium]
MKQLIVGLGNPGDEYAGTRHNAGFMILDALAKASNIVFDVNRRYGAIAEMRLKNKQLILLKPYTYMNLSGNAVRYWMQKEKIELQNLLIVLDDLALPFGALRLKSKGNDAGHNGLKSIQETLGTIAYNRLRFGIGNNFRQGGQVDFVLSNFNADELQTLPDRINVAVEAVKSFCLQGVETTMNLYNNK